MSAVIKCECGWSLQADSREDAAAAMEHHVADEHPDLPSMPSRADLLAMAEES
jgi:predicted small metal-binding protein